MTWISDEAVARLGAPLGEPDFTGTRYQLLGELDRGGMGVVYAAHDSVLGRSVAVKVLRARLLDAGAGDRLERESRILAALEHPGIVPVHDAGTLADGRAWVVMKQVRGRRLDAVARAGLSLAEALRLFARICEPVAFAHGRGVVHRDLKPENVMVGEFGEVLVLDWGLAKEVDPEIAENAGKSEPTESEAGNGSPPHAPPVEGATTGGRLTSAGEILGTRGFMAPEQERGEHAAITPRTDVWSLGRLLEELTAEAARRDGQRPPRALRAIVARATSPDPSDRYASASELAADVVRCADGAAVSAYRERPWEVVARHAREHRTAIAVVLAYLVMRALLQAWLGR